MWWRNFREKVNLSLYNSKEKVLPIFKGCHILIALSMIGVLIYYYGFPQNTESKIFLNRIIEFSFLFYIIRFLVQLIYELHPFRYIKSHWIESILILFLIVEGISYNFYNVLFISKIFNAIGFKDFTDFSNLIVQGFFVIYIFAEVFKKRSFRLHSKIHPGLLFMLSILGIILIGTGLLMLPEMTKPGYNISFLDSLFLSTSVTSCTGLTTFNISAILTLKGKLVVLFLLQIGALNAIAFVALYILIAKFGVGLKQHEVIEDYVNSSDSFLDSERIFYKIVRWVLAIELIGFICIFCVLEPSGTLQSTSSRLFFAMFQSVSSFCNAGVIMLPHGFLNPLIQNNYALNMVVIVLFFLGGIGMIYLFDMIGVKSLRERMKYPWKRLRFDTKVSLYTTLILTVIGAVVFFVLEYDRNLSDRSGLGMLVSTFYNSMAVSHTGSVSISESSLSFPFLIFAMFLMFIGASSGSSGGGIRVSTFAVLVSSVVAVIKRKPQVELFRHSLDNSLVLKAYSVFMFYIFGNLVGVFALTITEHAALASGQFQIWDLVFEHVSASCTVGMSTGITPHLTSGGKIIIALAMFIGRVGTLSIAYLFGKQVLQRYKYPKGHAIVG